MNDKNVDSYKVAVLTTLYKNDSPVFFREAIESVLNQTIGLDRINVYLYVDGPIPDALKSVLNDYIDKLHYVKFGEVNKGLPFGLNTLIDSISDEKYAFRMDMDDVCMPNRFEEQCKFMDDNPILTLSGCNSVEIDERGVYFNERTYPLRHDDIIASLPKCCPLLHPSFCIRVNAFSNNFFRYEIVHLAEDLAFVFNAAKLGYKMGNVQIQLMKWRISSDFIARRDKRRMIPEFKVYVRGIYGLYGLWTTSYIYPVARLIFRMMPSSIVKLIYESPFRRRFLK